ncbi:MAG: DUF2232 domain-containing protein [Thalassobaculum sp.]|uniref:DUF2232 domain-containing protein n=1 Tax=Thalassobaculum sp. TaxID=2022740 RepID=UPI0032EC828B
MNSGWLPVGAAAATSALLLFGAPAGSPGGMLLAVLATLPLFLVGLSWGAFHGAASGAAATFAILLSISTTAGLYYGIVNALPAALLIWQAERSPDRPDRLVIMLTACAAAPILAAALYFGMQEGGLQGVIRGELEPALIDSVVDPAGNTPPQWREFVEAVVGLLPAMAAMSWAMLIAINGALAQGVLRRFGKNRLPSPDIASIRLPRVMVTVFAVTLVLAFLPGGLGFLGSNLVPVAALPLFFGGLSLMHWSLRRSGSPGLWLGMLYVLLLVFGWPAVILALIGLLDAIFDFRGRAGPPPAAPMV